MLHTKGIVLRTVKYGETSIIADLYTQEHGLQSFIAGSVRSAKSNMPYSLFQPMQVLEIVSYFKEQSKALHRLKEVRLALHYERIPFDVKRGAVSLFLAEVLRKCIKEQEADTDFYHFLEDCLQYLDTERAQVATLPVWFLAQLTDWLGIRPAMNHPDAEAWLDLREGATTDLNNPLAEQLDPQSTALMFALLDTPLSQLQAVPNAVRTRLLEGLLKYYRLHLEQFKELHSHQVLNAIFHG